MLDSVLFDFQGAVLRLALVGAALGAGFWTLRVLIQAAVRDAFLAGVVVLVLGAGTALLFPDLAGKVAAAVCGPWVAGATVRPSLGLPDFRRLLH